jgi:hypothetical protein
MTLNPCPLHPILCPYTRNFYQPSVLLGHKPQLKPSCFPSTSYWLFSSTALLYPPPDSFPRPHNALMITRIGCRLVQETYRLFAQLHEVTLEPQIANSGLVFFAIAPVVLKEERQAACRIKEGALDGDLLNFRSLRDGQGLRR